MSDLNLFFKNLAELSKTLPEDFKKSKTYTDIQEVVKKVIISDTLTIKVEDAETIKENLKRFLE